MRYGYGVGGCVERCVNRILWGARSRGVRVGARGAGSEREM